MAVPSLQEENEVKSQIESKAGELKRVMGLTISCEGVYKVDEAQKERMDGLLRQNNRLQKAWNLIVEENRKIKVFEEFLA